jgi:hypothetical protein
MCLVAAALVFLPVYLRGLPGTPLGYDLAHLGALAQYALAVLGNGVLGVIDNQPALGVAMAFGLVEIVLILIASAMILRLAPAEREISRIPLGLIAFGGIGALTVALGRLNYGLATAISSRYVAITAPAMIGIYLLYVHLLAVRSLRASGEHDVSASRGTEAQAMRVTGDIGRWGLAGLTTAAAAILLFGAAFGDREQYQLRAGRASYYSTMEYWACHASSAPDAVLRVFQWNLDGAPAARDSFLRVALTDLRADGLSVFGDGTCSVLRTPPG